MWFLKYTVAVGLILFCVPAASGQFTGFLDTAENLDSGQNSYGAYLGFFEEGSFAIFGQYRKGLSNWVDIGFKGGVVSVDAGKDDELGFTLAADGKYRILNAAAGDQFDLSVGADVQSAFTSDYRVISISFNFIGSFRLVSESGKLIIPYACLSPVIQNHSWDVGGGPLEDESHSDTDFDLRLNLGSKFKLNNSFFIFGELQMEDDYFGFLGGVNFGP